MISLQRLFKESKDSVVHEKYKKRMARSCKYIKNGSMLPDMSFPKPGSKEFQEDIENIKHHHRNPCLPASFLKESDESVEDLFKTFCKENAIFVDWKFLGKLLEDVDTIVLNLKYKHNRPRPKTFLINDDDDYKNVKSCKSPSFPSGHTAIAYFIAEVIAKDFEQHAGDLRTFAELIGQSRIENCVHFPSDVLFGRMTGEMLADLYINGDSFEPVSKMGLTTKHYKKLSDKFFQIAKRDYPDLNESQCIKEYAHELAYFLHRTNQIERYNIDYGMCYDAALNFILGFPPEHFTDNPHLLSQFECLTMAHRIGDVNDKFKIVKIHEQFKPQVIERDTPGCIRGFSHSSPTGIKYPDTKDFNHCLAKVFQLQDPWLKHVCYEWVHPFSDGNGRSGRVMLCADLDFDLKRVNSLIGDDYIDKLVSFMSSRDMFGLFGI